MNDQDPLEFNRLVWTFGSIIFVVLVFYVILTPPNAMSFMRWLESAR